MIRAAGATGEARSAAARAAKAAVSRRTAPVWLVAGVIAAALVAIIALGGLDRNEATPALFTVGDEVRTPLYAVTVLGAELTDEIEEQSLSADPGETLVIVTMRLENLTNRPIGVDRAVDRVESMLTGISDPLLSLAGVTSTDRARVWRDDGSAGSALLQPEVSSEVTLAWTAPEDAFTDGTVELDVYDAVEARGQVLLSADHITWRRSDLTARISVDVGDGR